MLFSSQALWPSENSPVAHRLGTTKLRNSNKFQYAEIITNERKINIFFFHLKKKAFQLRHVKHEIQK